MAHFTGTTARVRHLTLVILGLLVSVSAAGALGVGQPAMATAPEDEAAVRALADRWRAAWNAHDMETMGTLLTDDADFVVVTGVHMKGRPGIVKEHVYRHGTQFKNSTWVTQKVNVQFVEPKVALLHMNWALSGEVDPVDGTPRKPREGVFTWVVVKRGNSWLIRAAQNTNLTPPPQPSSRD